MRLIPMSESELAWDLFYETEALRHYRTWVAPDTQAKVQQTWCRVDVPWERAGRGHLVARLVRELPRAGVDTRGCTHLRFFGAVSPGGALRLIVNGKTNVLRGTGKMAQYTVPIPGRRVRSLVFEAIAGGAERGVISLAWTALVDARADRFRLVQRGYYEESWDGLLRPLSERIEPRPEMDLLFDPDDLARIRRKAKTPLYAPWARRLRREAARMLTIKPETLIGRFASPPLGITRPPERPGFGGPGAVGRFDVLAFAGLLDGDPRLLRAAARWMLSIASCEYWYNDFAGELPGTCWHNRSFSEAHTTEQVAMALDWAGCALTGEGRKVVRDAILRRGLPRIQQDFMTSEYIRRMNQGIAFNTGRILGTLALCKAWPRAEARLPEIRRDTREMFGLTFDADGGSVEGPGYWLYTLHAGMPGVIALARHDGRRPADLLPPRMAMTPAYPAVFDSTVAPGNAVPIADSNGGPLCSGALAAMLTHVFPGRDSLRLAAAALRRPTESWNDPVLALIFGPAALPAAAPLVPGFALRRRTGHALVCREMPGVGRVRFQLYGAPGVGGSHSHEDRGNLLLEAGGEWVFTDRVIGDYTNTAHQFLKRPEAHNLLVPDMPDGVAPRQDVAHKRDILPSAVCRGGRFRAVIDTTAAWPAHVKRCRRTVVSPSPGVFEITDELVLDRPLGATLHLHTPLKPRRGAGPLVLEGKRVRATLQCEWAEDVQCRAEDMGAGASGQILGHLRLRAAPARRHRLVTRIVVAPKRQAS